ncbi:MAG TPA: DUF1508 domain-containing protein [Iamia sp.]|jgi:uncharacterized protein YegP (UPF0339 family)|nr:DUF1508 domain-containing protein [Iamia sp.]
MASQFEIYKDSAGEHRWRLRDGNNQITATSGEAFASKSNAERAAENVKGDAPDAPIVDKT